MPTEGAEAKGRRYLTEGRLTVKRIDSRGWIVAEARGGDAVYSLGYDPARRQWRCTCPAKGRCAHLVALQLVTLRPPSTEGGTT